MSTKNPEELRKAINNYKVSRAPVDIEFLIGRVGKLIEYAIGRVDYYESTRSKIFTASWTLLAFGAALLTFGVQYLLNTLWLLIPILILMSTGIVSIVVHLYYNNFSYSFRKVADSPWFYIYNIKRWKEKKEYTGSKDEVAQAFFSDLEDNLDKRTTETRPEALKIDIEQLVLLYVIMGYKRKFSGITTTIVMVGFVIALGSLIVLFAVTLFLHGIMGIPA